VIADYIIGKSCRIPAAIPQFQISVELTSNYELAVIFA